MERLARHRRRDRSPALVPGQQVHAGQTACLPLPGLVLKGCLTFGPHHIWRQDRPLAILAYASVIGYPLVATRSWLKAFPVTRPPGCYRGYRALASPIPRSRAVMVG